MWFRERFNNILTGVISGIILPVLAFLVFFLFTRHGMSLGQYIKHMEVADNVTEIMSVSVFTNIIIFLLFNRFDMLRSSKGVLGITIIWAFAVFAIKLF
jgi:heme/copper-type cytochrome/quinol oxidase subunit 2